MKEHIDITIYINNMKLFLEENTQAANYFYGEGGKDAFFMFVKIFATKNYEEHGDPVLTIEQFELIRSRINDVKRETVTPHTIIPFSLN